jgi:hypothetical protein
MSNAGHDFAVAFANTVTVSSYHEFDWVARNGTYNIFNLFHRLCPTVSYEQPCFQNVLTKSNLLTLQALHLGCR